MINVVNLVTSLLRNLYFRTELRWMGFLSSPDGWRLRFLFLETPPPPYFYYYFCKKSIKRVGVEVRFVIGKAPASLRLRLPPLSLWLVPIQQQIEAGDDSSQGLFSSFTSRRRLHEPSDVNQQGFSLSPLSNNESCSDDTISAGWRWSHNLPKSEPSLSGLVL